MFSLHRIIALQEPVPCGQKRDLPFLPNFMKDREEDVTAFLDVTHPDRYHIFKCCPPTAVSSDISFLTASGLVTIFPVEDSSPPSLETVAAFCDCAAAWLRNPSNVAVVQCPDGIGIAGVMICCFLLSQGLFKTPDRALSHFKRMRLRNPLSNDAIFDRTPSFARYISYFFQCVRRHSKAHRVAIVGSPRPVRVVKVQVAGLSDARDVSIAIWLRPRGPNSGEILDRVFLLATPGSTAAQQFYCTGSVASRRTKACEDNTKIELVLCHWRIIDSGAALALWPTSPVDLDGDVKIQASAGEFRRSKALFTSWFNTSFMATQDGVFLPTEELDRDRRLLYSRSPSLDLMFESNADY